MNKNQRIHQTGVEKIVCRLLAKNYDAVLMNVPYEANGMRGELDILAIRGKVAHYYEVKTNDTDRAYYKAEEQINRVQMAFPMWNIRGVYVPMNGRPERVR